MHPLGRRPFRPGASAWSAASLGVQPTQRLFVLTSLVGSPRRTTPGDPLARRRLGYAYREELGRVGARGFAPTNQGGRPWTADCGLDPRRDQLQGSRSGASSRSPRRYARGPVRSTIPATKTSGYRSRSAARCRALSPAGGRTAVSRHLRTPRRGCTGSGAAAQRSCAGPDRRGRSARPSRGDGRSSGAPGEQ